MFAAKKIIAVFLLCFFSSITIAESSPVALLQRLSNQMIAELKAKKIILKQNPKAVHSMVRRVLLPYVDMNKMSQAVLGAAWAQASPAQRKDFMARFTTILIGTYSQALASYTSETIEFLPMRSSGGNDVRVDSRIIRQGAPSIPVSYRLIRNGGSWKVYDLIVDGVSLIQSYRSQFSSIIQSQGGMNGLLRSMAAHNSR